MIMIVDDDDDGSRGRDWEGSNGKDGQKVSSSVIFNFLGVPKNKAKRHQTISRALFNQSSHKIQLSLILMARMATGHWPLTIAMHRSLTESIH